MVIGVIAHTNEPNYAASRLIEAIKIRNCQPTLISPDEISAEITQTHARLFVKGKAHELDGLVHIISTDAVASLKILGATNHYLGILHASSHTVPYLNSMPSVLMSADKFLTGVALVENSIPHPPTAYIIDDQDLKRFAGKYGFPVVIKQPDGAEGNEVALVSSKKDLLATAQTIRDRGKPLLVQKLVVDSIGRDIRIVVVGGVAVASMERRAKKGEFRSNLHKGATAHPVELTEKERFIAEKTASVIGLDIVGVDMMRTKQGPVVIETNSFPGLEGIETCTKVDIAGEIIELLIQKVGRRPASGQLAAE